MGTKGQDLAALKSQRIGSRITRIRTKITKKLLARDRKSERINGANGGGKSDEK